MAKSKLPKSHPKAGGPFEFKPKVSKKGPAGGKGPGDHAAQSTKLSKKKK